MTQHTDQGAFISGPGSYNSIYQALGTSRSPGPLRFSLGKSDVPSSQEILPKVVIIYCSEQGTYKGKSELGNERHYYNDEGVSQVMSCLVSLDGVKSPICNFLFSPRPWWPRGSNYEEDLRVAPSSRPSRAPLESTKKMIKK